MKKCPPKIALQKMIRRLLSRLRNHDENENAIGNYRKYEKMPEISENAGTYRPHRYIPRFCPDM